MAPTRRWNRSPACSRRPTTTTTTTTTANRVWDFSFQGDSPGDAAGSAVLESALPLKGEALLASLVVSRTLEIGRPVLDRNGRLAERNRACLREHG